jgi:hypothetical protein
MDIIRELAKMPLNLHHHISKEMDERREVSNNVIKQASNDDLNPLEEEPQGE